MYSVEPHVDSSSAYYVHTPSTAAKRLFFYPVCTGHFIYNAGYHLKRDRYDSFLLMLVTKGNCTITVNHHSYAAASGELVFLDCYKPHEYKSDTGWESIWLHFDGPMARAYYEQITSQFGTVLTPRNFPLLEHILSTIYSMFHTNTYIQEAVVSNMVNTLLTELLLSNTKKEETVASPLSLSDSISYIQEHFAEPISLETLASRASLSMFYFTRRFTKETGMTPHQYIIATRINYAKFLLKTTTLSSKEIAFSSGFTSESNFCTTFKKWERLTPYTYRSLDSSSS